MRIKENDTPEEEYETRKIVNESSATNDNNNKCDIEMIAIEVLQKFLSNAVENESNKINPKEATETKMCMKVKSIAGRMLKKAYKC